MTKSEDISNVDLFRRSIRFRIWRSFFLFTVAILVFLFISQVVLMPAIYRFIKTQECISTALDIKDAWNTEELNTVIDDNARNKQLGILIHLPTSSIGGLPFTYSRDTTGSAVSIDRRVSDEMVEELRGSKTGMVFFPVKDDTKDSFLLATYVGTAQDPVGYIFIYAFLEPTGTTTQILANIFLMSSLVIILVSLIVSAWISTSISKPIRGISGSADKLITGEFDVPVSRHDYSEIIVLKDNLNKASAEISKTEKLRKDLLANISHDLRTPLTMIKAYAEMIRDLSGDNPEKRAKHLGVIIDESDRLNLLVNDILNLSKLQSGAVEMDKRIINFSALLRDIVSRFAMLDETKIILECDEDIHISADSKQLGQAVYNLIINAINYSGVDTVTVRLSAAGTDTVRFEVADKGVGISAEQLPYIWERYYKVNRSENYKRAVKGTGLGLSIVKSVFEAHGFRYGVESEEGNGTTFWFECKREQPENENDTV
ncbi:MAG: sensor histidine kinase [Ruminiclostridium sp.]|nr:sensor histidine kinase [Ruminiclostridium sp.]